MTHDDMNDWRTSARVGRGAELRLDGMRVLVIDDEPDARALLEILFRKRGACVRLAASASEGRELLATFHPDVIVSDISMPGEDGYQFIRSVRALPRNQGGATPAAALTAHAYGEDRLRALEAGFDRHLTKPVQHDVLVRTVWHLADKT